MRLTHLLPIALSTGLLLTGCGKQSPDAPEASVPATPSAPATTVASALGEIARVEVFDVDETATRRTERSQLTDAARIAALLRAIGPDQVPQGELRRCPDILVLVMRDASGAAKGELGICALDELGPEFTPTGGARNGLTLADEAAFRAILDLPGATP